MIAGNRASHHPFVQMVTVVSIGNVFHVAFHDESFFSHHAEWSAKIQGV